MKINEINFVPVKPNNGLLAFASFVADGRFYIGNVAVFSRRDGLGIRLLYPTKKGINCFYPIDKKIGAQITETVEKQYKLFLNSNENVSERRIYSTTELSA
jgi:stage V sporulation protein G